MYNTSVTIKTMRLNYSVKKENRTMSITIKTRVKDCDITLTSQPQCLKVSRDYKVMQVYY